MQGTWQTTGGGSGLLEVVAAILVIAVVASIAGPVVAAVGELVHILLIAVAVIGGLAAVGLVAFIAYWVRRRRSVSGAARAARPPALVRAARPLPPPQAIERAPEVHLHFHGVTAGDVAAILQDSPGVNLDGQQRVTWAWPRQDG
jgi:Tfp pilus assembly major pilin PilA